MQWNLNENTMLWSVFVSLGESGGNLKTSPYQVTDLDSKKHTTAAHEVGHNFMVRVTLTLTLKRFNSVDVAQKRKKENGLHALDDCV